MTSQPGQQTIVIHILPNISRSKRIYQLLKAIRQWHLIDSQLIDCNIRNIFLGKSCTKYGWETSPRSFSGSIA